MPKIGYPDGKGGFVYYGTPQYTAMRKAQKEASKKRRDAGWKQAQKEGYTKAPNGQLVDPYGWTTGSPRTAEMFKTAYERGTPLPTFKTGPRNYGSIAGQPYVDDVEIAVLEDMSVEERLRGIECRLDELEA